MIVRLSDVPECERRLLGIADLAALVRADARRPATRRRRVRRVFGIRAAAPGADARPPASADSRR